MSNKKLTKNYIYNLIYQVLLVVSPVITIPFLSRTLGVSGIGQYSYAFSLTNYFTLIATLGCDVYGRREISYVKDSIQERTQKFWSVEFIKIICTSIMIVFYIIFSLFSDNKVLLLILGFHLINVPLNIGWFYQGIEEFKTITIRGFILKIAEITFVLLCIHSPNDLVLYTFGISFINFVAFFALWVDLKKYLTKFNKKQHTIKNDFKKCIVFFIPSIATSIYTLLDKVMLGNITGSYIENGYYEQAQKINLMLLKIVLALGTVLLPQIASAFKKKNYNLVNESIKKSLKYVFFISIPLAFGLVCISDLFVPWFFGEQFSKVSILLKISGFIMIFQGIDDVFGMQYLVSVGKEKAYIISLFGGAIINFTCNLILIPKLLSVGAIMASLIGEILIVIIQSVYVRKELNVLELLKSSKNYIFASVLMLLTLIMSKNMESNVINTIIVTMTGMVIYFLTLVILKDDTLKTFFELIRKKRKGKKSENETV